MQFNVGDIIQIRIRKSKRHAKGMHCGGEVVEVLAKNEAPARFYGILNVVAAEACIIVKRPFYNNSTIPRYLWIPQSKFKYVKVLK